MAGAPRTFSAADDPRSHSDRVINGCTSGRPGACRATSCASATYFATVAGGPLTL
jgi:hypothetical protein